MNQPTQFDILNGGRSVTIKTRAGLDETVNVRQLPVRMLPQYLDAQTNEAVMIELVTGRPAQWVDQLTPEAHVALVAAAEEVNADFFGSWLSRLRARQTALAELVKDKA